VYHKLLKLDNPSSSYGKQEIVLDCDQSNVLLVGIISPPKNDSFRKDLCFMHDVFFYSTRDLRDAWTDRREILHDGQY